MRELRFDGLSPDGTRLILAGKDGQKWSVVIDERIEAAVRRDRARIGQVEIEQAGLLRPREIQARIRAGATAEDVAAASGLPIEHVRRFEGPVLTERAWVAQQAQSTEVRRPGGDIELGDLVAERLHHLDVDPADVSWDAWRRDDGLWVVIATFPVAPNTHVATWTYDSSSRTMTVADDNARALSAISPDAPLHLAPARPTLTSVAPLAEAVGADEEDPEESAQVVILGRQAGRAPSVEVEDVEDADPEGGDAEDEPSEGDAELDEEAAVSGDGAQSWAEEALAEGVVIEEVEEVIVTPIDDETVLLEVIDEVIVLEEVPVVGLADPEGLDDSDELNAEDDSAQDEVAQEADEDDADEDPEDGSSAAAPDAQVTGELPLFDAPAAPTPRPTGKPAVPSFDDILFGPGPGTRD